MNVSQHRHANLFFDLTQNLEASIHAQATETL
jgi:hypothetical protein